ncbi:MAG: thiamine-phosphate kinase [Akkermansia sp.]
MTTLNDMGEEAIVHALTLNLSTNEALLIGAGDDCAVVQKNEHWDELLKTDCIVQDIHFTPDTLPHLIGRKALARALSDIAAMGGRPIHALITIFAHGDMDGNILLGAYEGINQLAQKWGVSIAGGETSSLPQPGFIINVCLTGIIPHGQAILRSTARQGDLIAVTGQLGGSFSSGHHLTFIPRIREAELLRQHGLPTSMMDLSDGLGIDLSRLAKASHLGFHLNSSRIPCRKGCSIQQSLGDGEDYELLFTLSPDRRNELKAIEQTLDTPITIIGTMENQQNDHPFTGWQHFTSSPRH